MRVLATNPDALGDLVLRQPLFAAILGAGHELMLVVHARHAEIASRIAPGAGIATFAENPYRGRFEPESQLLDPIAVHAKSAAPDVLLVMPFQWTAVDVRIARKCGAGRRVRLGGRSWTEGQGYPAMPLEGFEVVEVEEGQPEVEKNHRLLECVLGAASERREPVLATDPRASAAGRAAVSRLWREDGGFWIACIGESIHTRVRNWPLERWAAALREWTARWRSRFLLIGNEGERESLQRVAAGVGGAARVWTGGEEGSLLTLEGLIALSEGYVGRDTGPMHLAAAMGKRVLAVFGGGTFPRFLPRARESVSLTVGVPCAGCGWSCHLSESVCIVEVPEREVVEAGHRLWRGEVREREVRVLPAGEPLLVRIGLEGALAARDAKRRGLLAVRRAIGGVAPGAPSDGMDLNDRLEEAERLAQERLDLIGEHGRARNQLGVRIAEVQAKLDRAMEEVARLQARLRERPGDDARDAIVVPRVESPKPALEDRSAREAKPVPDRDAMGEELTALRQSVVDERTRASDAVVTSARLTQDLNASAAHARKQEAEVAGLRASTKREAERTERARLELERAVSRVTDLEARIRSAEERLGALLGTRWNRIGERLGVAKAVSRDGQRPDGEVRDRDARDG